MKKLLVVFVLYISFATVYSFQNSGWHWLWACNTSTGQCEKSSQPVAPNQITERQFVSQHVCRLTCGKYGALWPVPTVSTYIDDELVYFHPSAIKYNLLETITDSVQFFNEIISIFDENIRLECNGNCTIPSEATITIYASFTSDCVHLHPDVDESYSLDVTTKSSNTVIRITAETVFGVRHALETLSQLIASYKLPTHDSSRKVGLALVANAKIKDKPVFKHRGLLLDPARNYLTINSIKKQIDAMAASKMNVLHLHASDSQSFPIVSKRVPELSKYGAYSENHVYQLSDIAALVRYARYRGIRFLLEIDAPSHAGNGWQWGPTAGLGNLAVCVNQVPWRTYCIQPPCGQLNPANKNVFKVLGALYKDLVEVGERGEWFHMGGDEVFINCWNTTEEIIGYMNKKGWGRRTTEDFLNLWSEYQENSLRTYDTVVGNNNTPIILWSSQLTEPDYIEKYLPKNRYVIQTWVPTTNDMPARLLEKGYRLIISTKNAWYLDHGFWGTTQYYNWRTVYKNRIPRHPGVLGGEACMWGEYVDKLSIDARVWPRVAAVAERLWSDPDFDTGAVETRFYRHRDRLITRGIAADGLAPAWCFMNEGECR